MATTVELGPERKDISRVVKVGRALYVLLPKKVCELAGLKRGDRLCMETDGQMVYAARVPFEELMARKTKPNGGNARVQVRPDGWERRGK
jgi:bifunctional DNA-binding transcriptional regulator/antitoxin component of YhaV-PrlF toxin-antitoxin module